MTLRVDHHIGLIQDENRNFFDVKSFEFDTPIENFTRGANYNVVI